MDINNTSQTEWNGGTLTNIRIHDIKNEIRMAAAMLDIRQWRILLEQWNVELVGFESPEEDKEIKDRLLLLAEKINRYDRTKQFSKGKRPVPIDIMDGLLDIEYRLAKVFHKSGLQTALKEDAGDAF